ncbi:MAG: DoxX family protein [Patescibacteria group bacterium]|nr:DoxX family protein [Patescibacteria group bacterium]MDE2116268.1 DoxX family protein [Patescibacteria group bacterium]
MTKTQKAVYYVLLVLVSALFVFSGVSKLMAVPVAVQSFTIAHLPIWFMYVVGIVEVLGAISLWMRSFVRASAIGLYIVLTGAFVTTWIYVNFATALFPLAVAVALGFILCLGKKRSSAVG